MKHLIISYFFTILPMLSYAQLSNLELEGPTSKISFRETSGGSEKAYIRYNGKDIHIVTDETDGFIFLDGQQALGFRINGATRMLVDNMGEVGINTSSPTSTLHVNGYTRLGNTAPKIQMKKLTGTLSLTVNGIVQIAHGLDHDKILSVEALMVGFSGGKFPPNGNFEIATIDETYVLLKTLDLFNFDSGTVTLLITYEE